MRTLTDAYPPKPKPKMAVKMMINQLNQKMNVNPPILARNLRWTEEPCRDRKFRVSGERA
jgi:hypothetical protein